MNKTTLVKIGLLVIGFLVLLLFVVSSFPARTNYVSKGPQLEEIKTMCALGTTEIDYNNVAHVEKEDWFFGKKQRKMWIEYKAIVKTGIDVEELEMEKKGNKIRITIPAAKVLSIVCDLDSFNEESFRTSKAFPIKFTAKDQNTSIAEANKNIRETTENNKDLMRDSQLRAKKIIQNYIDEFTTADGLQYEVEWELK